MVHTFSLYYFHESLNDFLGGYTMDSLVETLAEIKMATDDGMEADSPELQKQFKDAMARVKADTVEEEMLAQLDSDTYSGWTAMMFACTLLQGGWMTRMLNAAKKAESHCPELRKRMLALRNSNRENALMILIEAEQVRSQEIADDEGSDEPVLLTKRIQQLVTHGAVPSDARGGPSAKSYAIQLGETTLWDKIDCRPKKTLTKKVRSPAK
jgi:hypothetical protein